MKKIGNWSKYRAYQRKRTRKALKDKVLFNLYLRNKNKNLIGVKKNDNTSIYYKNKKYLKIKAPDILSFITQPESVIRFINKLKSAYDKNEKVFVILQHVKEIDYDAIIVLLSIMVRFKSKKISFNGDLPNDKIAANVLIKSGFFENLYKEFKDNERYTLRSAEGGHIHTHAWKKVDPVLADKVITKASKFIWNEKRRLTGVYRTLQELMQNTNNHATPNIEGDKHWWLSVNHKQSEGKVCFCFVDYGVGVISSLQSKPKGNKFFGAIESLYNKFKYGNDSHLLKLILDGELHKTVTGEYYRGKGLPGIKEAMDRSQLTNLCIITNNVYGDVASENFKILSNNFSGTFVYWEIKRETVSYA